MNFILSFLLKEWRVVIPVLLVLGLLLRIEFMHREIVGKDATILQLNQQVAVLDHQISDQNAGIQTLNNALNARVKEAQENGVTATQKLNDLKNKLNSTKEDNLNLNRQITDLNSCTGELAAIKQQLIETEQMFRDSEGK
jgi:predicted  nucleic acid-binding Zn-ribbon protein